MNKVVKKAPFVIALMFFIVIIAACSGQPANPNDAQTGNQAETSSGGQKDTPAGQIKLTLGTSTLGSSFYALSQGFAKIIIEKNPNISMNVEPIGGSDASVNAIKDGIAQIATTNGLSASNAYQGIGPFEKTGKIELRLLVQGEETIRPVVTLKKSEINEVSDLTGKKFIAKRRSLAELELVANAMFNAYNIPEAQRPDYIMTADTKEATEALKLGSAQAAIIPGFVPTALLTELSITNEISIIDIPDDKMKLMLEELGSGFSAVTIPANTYKGQTEEVQVPAIPSILVASPDVDEDTAYRIVKSIFENNDELTKLYNTAKYWNIETTLQNTPAVPFHPGAVKYFKEKGLWTEELQKTQDGVG